MNRTNSFNLGKSYKFTFANLPGIVRCYPSGAREIQWGGMTFEYEAAHLALKAAIDAAII